MRDAVEVVACPAGGVVAVPVDRQLEDVILGEVGAVVDQGIVRHVEGQVQLGGVPGPAERARQIGPLGRGALDCRCGIAIQGCGGEAAPFAQVAIQHGCGRDAGDVAEGAVREEEDIADRCGLVLIERENRAATIPPILAYRPLFVLRQPTTLPLGNHLVAAHRDR